MGAECCTPNVKLDEKEEIRDISIACAQPRPAEEQQEEEEEGVVEQKYQEQALQDVLDIDPRVYSNIDGRNQFAEDLQKEKSSFRIKRYVDGRAYEGQLDANGRPHGLGRLQLEDGSLIIGQFHESVLNGAALYAHKDQVYCSGVMIDGKLNCYKGLLQAPNFKYQGGFKDNKFDGEGTQTTEESKFVGEYKEGKRMKGRLIWKIGEKDVYEYTGPFNSQEEFEGEGILLEPFGEYRGHFVEGEKHGHGVYRFSSGLQYEGDYRRGKRQGVGKLINRDGTTSYEGQFQDGLPNGSGRSFKNGELIMSGTFKKGICEDMLL